jgi:hypothetical protein
MSYDKRRRAAEKVRAFMRQGQRKRLSKAALGVFASFVIAAAPPSWGLSAKNVEYDNACRETTATRYVTHYGGCKFVWGKRVGLMVTADGHVIKIGTPDVRLFR